MKENRLENLARAQKYNKELKSVQKHHTHASDQKSNFNFLLYVQLLNN